MKMQHSIADEYAHPDFGGMHKRCPGCGHFEPDSAYHISSHVCRLCDPQTPTRLARALAAYDEAEVKQRAAEAALPLGAGCTMTDAEYALADAWDDDADDQTLFGELYEKEAH